MIELLPKRLEVASVDVLQAGESVIIKLKGGRFMIDAEALVCTNRRVIILKGGFLSLPQVFGTNVFQLPYGSIAGVQVKFNLLAGYFEINSGGMQNEPKRYWSKHPRFDAEAAPNCVSIFGSERAAKYRVASNFIMRQVEIYRTNQNNNSANMREQNSQDQILVLLERLCELKDRGHLTDEEFQAKKIELLRRM